jgi:hypothetical protein
MSLLAVGATARRSLARGAVSALGAWVLCTSSLARADVTPDPTSTTSLPSWPTVTPTYRWWDAALTAATAGITLGVYFGVPLASAHWDGPILFDAWTRDRLRVTSPGALANVRKISDVMSFTSVAWVVADTAITPVSEVDVAWSDRGNAPHAVPVDGLALEQIRDGRKADVRVRRDVETVPGRHRVRPHVVEEHEGPDGTVPDGRQHAAHRLPPDLARPAGNRRFDGAHRHTP